MPSLAAMPKSMSLMRVSLAHHDVFRFQVAVHDAQAVNVIEGFADSGRDAGRAFDGKFSFLGENFAQEAPVNPFHHDAELVHVAAVEHSHDARMLELLADGDFALEAAIKNGIAFEFGVRDFDGNKLAGSQVRGAIDRGHAGAQDERFDAEVLESLARLKLLRQHLPHPSRARWHTVTCNQNSFWRLKKA